MKSNRLSRVGAHALVTLTLLTATFALSGVASAWVPGQPLVPCSGSFIGSAGQQDCDFNALIVLISNLIQFLLFLASIVAALIFAYAGFLYIFAAGDPHKIEHAHSLFWTAGIGLALMAAAWLIVAVIINVLGAEEMGGQFLENI